MTPSSPRKRLRERVAARKAGLPENEEGPPATKRPWRKWMSWTGAILQVAMLVLVILEALRMARAGFAGADLGLVVIYLIVFFAGRVLQLLAQIRR